MKFSNEWSSTSIPPYAFMTCNAANLTFHLPEKISVIYPKTTFLQPTFATETRIAQ
jgi:hypothetical protein